jgi:Zn-dependent protease/CBS domain-containing protein
MQVHAPLGTAQQGQHPASVRNLCPRAAALRSCGKLHGDEPKVERGAVFAVALHAKQAELIMKWAVRIARIAGIDIRVHVTFVALLAWIAWVSYATTGVLASVLDGLLLLGLVFSIIVAHELAHALTARHFGIRTRDITLLPIGGVSSLERMPDDPRQELLVALAGPALNFALAAVLAVIALALGGTLVPTEEIRMQPASLLVHLSWINLMLGLFNLLPAFPMDGGRVLRALLALRVSDVRATQIAAGIGQAMAIALGIIGLFVSPVLVFIALFLWIGASGEGRVAEAKFIAHGLPVSAAMVREFETVAPDLPISAPLGRGLETAQHDFPVVTGQDVVGMLGRDAMLKALASDGPTTLVREVMRPNPTLVHLNDNLDDAFMKVMQTGEALPVIDAKDRLVGILTSESVADFFLIRQALRKSWARGVLPGPRMVAPQDHPTGSMG